MKRNRKAKPLRNLKQPDEADILKFAEWLVRERSAVQEELLKLYRKQSDKAGTLDFAGWLVRERSAVQKELLKLYRILVTVDDKELLKIRTPLFWLLGAGFSLWRAVFLANSSLDISQNIGGARKFLEKVILDNVIGYFDDKNSWSFGYYLNNARFRLVQAANCLTPQERAKDKKGLIKHMEGALLDKQSEGRDEFKKAIVLLGLMIDLCSKRLDR